MKKYLAIFFGIFIFAPACVGHEVWPAEEAVQTPAPPKPIPYDADKLDGHYNTHFSVLDTDCTESDLADTYEKVDFVSYDSKSGMIIFENKFYWDWVEIDLDKTGKFNKTMAPDPFSDPFTRIGYWGFGLKISGELKDNKLNAVVTDLIYTGSTLKSLALYCSTSYSAKGSKRYKQLETAPKNIEGEYKTKITRVYQNTCSGSSFLNNNFSTLIIPQKNGTLNIRIDVLALQGLPISKDGFIDAKFKDAFDNSYIFQGEITPSKFDVDVKIVWTNQKCEEWYRIEGKKRFEESDGNDSTIDGIYNSWILITKNTCDSRAGGEYYHADSLKIADNKVLFIIGNKTFSADIKNDGSFTVSEADKNEYGLTNSFKGSVSPSQLFGTMTFKLKWPGFECEYEYSVNGAKLYKHN